MSVVSSAWSHLVRGKHKLWNIKRLICTTQSQHCHPVHVVRNTVKQLLVDCDLQQTGQAFVEPFRVWDLMSVNFFPHNKKPPAPDNLSNPSAFVSTDDNWMLSP